MLGGIFGECTKSVKNTDNICNNSLNEVFDSRGFCTAHSSGANGTGGTGTEDRREYCSELGDVEWEYAGQGENCCYAYKSHSHNRINCNCNNAQGGNIGKCRRINFRADHLLCCLRDMACHKDYPSCFENNDAKRTCPPEYRDMASSSCRALMMDYCTGGIGENETHSLSKDDINSPNWQNRWLENQTIIDYEGKEQTFYKPCYSLIYRQLYNGQPGACLAYPIPGAGIATLDGYRYDQDLILSAVNKYIQQGGDLASGESSESNIRLNDMIWGICSTTPGLCDKMLYNYCANVTNETILRNPNLLKWCGCHMPAEQYNTYTELYGVNRECTPVCNMTGTLKIGDGNSFRTCKQSTCIIEDININIAKSQYGNITFNQLCNSCTAGNNSVCNCLVGNSNFTLLDIEQGSLNISQNCSGDSVCYSQVVNNGKIENVRVPCVGDNINPYENTEEINKKNKRKSEILSRILIGVIITGVILILIVIWYILSKKKIILDTNNTGRMEIKNI